MSKKKEFNKGLLTIEKNNLTFALPTSDVHCISHNELDYLREDIEEAVPLDRLEQVQKQLFFTWKIPEGFKPISSVYRAPRGTKLKTAKSFMKVASYFYNSDLYTTILEPDNIYVDQDNHVKVVFYTNKYHLPAKYKTDQEMLRDIKKILFMLLTTIKEKDAEDRLSSEDGQENDSEQQNPIEKIISATTFSELQRVVDDAHELYLAHEDEYIAMEEQKKKRKRIIRLSVSVVGIVVIIAGIYIGFRITGDKIPILNKLI